MRMVTRLASTAVVLGIFLFATDSPALARQSGEGLGLELQSAQPDYAQGDLVRLTLKVTNATGVACGLSSTTDGTVQVTSVRKDGQELFPLLGQSFYLDGINNAIKAGTASTEPGSKVDLSLTGKTELRSAAVMADGSSLDTIWPIGGQGEYEVTASYGMPAASGACAGTSESQTVTFTIGKGKSDFPLWVPIAALALLAVLALIVVVLVRKRRKAPAAAVLIVLALIVSAGAVAKPAHADYEIDPTSGIPVPNVDFRGAVNNCLALFTAAGGEFARMVDQLKSPTSPKVTIVPTTSESKASATPESKDGPRSSTVAWNPTSIENYEGDVARDPCSALFHELSHADDISNNKVPPGDCADTGIKTAEVKATMAENRYRAARKLDPRKKYEGKDLPESLNDCKKPPKKPTKPPKGPVKLCEGSGANECGSTNGDPHLVTFDRAYYDLQAVGEFVVARSTSGAALEIQARQTPMGPSRTVSINSAVALRLGTQKVELVIVNGVTQVRVDGQVKTMPRGDEALPGGGTITRRESDLGPVDGYDVEWPDGSGIAADQIGGYGYRLLIRLDKSRAGKVQGVLGNFDGDPANDIATPDGQALEQPVPFEKLYPSYADSWRVRQSDSLFTYAEGQSTETFTDRAYPEKPFTIADLTEAQRAQAEQICRWAGVTDPWQLRECIFDVGATGRTEFAVSSASSELIAPPVAAPIDAKPIATGTQIAGGANRLTFAGKAGQHVFTDLIAPTLGSLCSPYKLLDPEGKELSSGCNISGLGHIDRTELKSDGQYSVVLDAPGMTGKATARVYLAEDLTGSIQPNGDSVSANIEQPGAIATYKFSGKAGQRVFLDVPESTLPSQCSPLELRNPAGTLISSGCVVSGYGDIDGTLLTADGDYTIVIDPRDRTIGTVHMRLFSAADVTSNLAVNGAAAVADISQPGLVVRYQFNGTAGMTLSIDVTESTLPNQCSSIHLVNQEGRVIEYGCVINGVGGIKDVTLPAGGVYAVLVDPAGSATGKASVALRGN
jgi:hypothetical protein